MLCDRRPKLLPGLRGRGLLDGETRTAPLWPGRRLQRSLPNDDMGAPVHARETPPLARLELGDTVACNRRPQPPSLTADVTLSSVLICMKNQDIL